MILSPYNSARIINISQTDEEEEKMTERELLSMCLVGLCGVDAAEVDSIIDRAKGYEYSIRNGENMPYEFKIDFEPYFRSCKGVRE